MQFTSRKIFADLRAAVAMIGQQLPYLLVTGTSENYLRDSLAYQLSTKHRYIARDYRIRCNNQIRKADIAVLDDSGPSLILELKQLYLKDFRRAGHGYIKNIVNDVAVRRSVCADVYGIILVRRIPPDVKLPWVKKFAYSYVKEDHPFAFNGIERLHQVVVNLPNIKDCYLTRWQLAQLLPIEKASLGIELYAWVFRAI